MKRIAVVLSSMVASSLLWATAATAAAAGPRVIVNNARFANASRTDGVVVIGDGVITASGHGFTINKRDRSADVVIDAKGGLVLPGFHDSHIHMLGGGLSLVRAQLAGPKTLAQLQKVVVDYVKAHPDRPWVLGRGWSYALVPTGTLPTAKMLDDVVSDRPIYIRAYDGHTGWANSKALQLAGITKATKDPADGEIVRDADGNPTGALKEGAQDLMDAAMPQPTRAEKKAALLAAAQHCVALGLTAVDDIVYEVDAFELYSELEDEGLLPIRVRISPLIEVSPDVAGDLDVYAMWREKLKGHRLLSFGFLKGFVDGVIESKTAFMTAPYHDSDHEVGRPLIPPARLIDLVDHAHARGFQVALHSIGDGAVRLSLDAFEAAAKHYPKMKIRHRIEHIELLHVDDVKRFQKLDVVASMQPYHVNPFGDEPQKGPWAENLGPERWPMTMPWHTIVDAGGALTFGSDWPVFTANPLHGLAVAVSRRDEDGLPKAGWNAQQVVTVEQALHAYTVERGEIRGPSRTVGTLAPGQRADVVVLDPKVKLDDVTTWWPGTVSAVIVDGEPRSLQP